jgi:hypothetical protein
MARTSVGGFSGDDLGKVLAVLGALIAVGVLPKGWQKGVSAATALLLISRLL